MKIIQDEGRFDDLQISLTEKIVQTIHNELKDTSLDASQREDFVGRIAFGICALLDGSVFLPEGEDRLVPVIGFSLDEETDEILIPESSSWMHEYVFGAVDQEFGSDDGVDVDSDIDLIDEDTDVDEE